MNKLNKNELCVVYLDYYGLTRRQIYLLTEKTTNLYELLTNPLSLEVKTIIGEKKLLKLPLKSIDKNLEKLEKYLIDLDVSVSTIISDNYPENLKNINGSPAVIYYRGDFEIINSPNILAIVGTRKPTDYGRSVAQNFTKELVQAEVITISGLAYGIDSEVARATINNNGKTIAVLGGGISQIYPASNVGLANKIIKTGGLILSEYFPTVRPTQYTFPERNRIISGLSRGVLVIEAGLNSGSLITASLAIEQGKDLFVIPGEVGCVSTMGSNQLISEIPNTFTTSPDTILKAFNLKKQECKVVDLEQYSTKELNIINALMNGTKSTDELCEILGEDFKTINKLLTEMEINGIISKLSGDYYKQNLYA